jgi:hypothetical protein
MNGEVCITGLVPPAAGAARLAHCLTWLLSELASRCRRTRAASGVLAFTCTGPRTPTPLARALSLFFDLALQDAGLICDHVRRRSGREPAACRWPGFWLEGATSAYWRPDYFIRGVLPPLGRVAPRKLLVLAEEREAFVPARPAPLAARIRRTWADTLEVLAGVDDAALTQLLGEDEQGFLASMLVLVHAQPVARVLPRPSLESSYRRHETLVAELAPLAEGARLPVAWHALWRLPPGMTCGEPGGGRWLRYPAVSVVVAARPFAPARPGSALEATGGVTSEAG